VIPSWTTLEKLPYLTAVIHEGLRLGYGIAARTARIATEEDLVYRNGSVEFVIPRDYAIGMSTRMTHHDESFFPDSNAFVPERWLDEHGRHRKDLDRGMMAWGRGSRGCVGIR